jgi:hypothetical protein
MPAFDAFVGERYIGQERLVRDGINRRAVPAGLPVAALEVLDQLPGGEYAHRRHEPTPANVEPAGRTLAEDGPAAIERGES